MRSVANGAGTSCLPSLADCHSRAQPNRVTMRFKRRASFSANPLMFAGFLNRTVGLSRDRSLTSISTKADSRAYAEMLLPSEGRL